MRRTLPILLCLSAGCSSSAPEPKREPNLARAEIEYLSGNYGRAAHLYEQALDAVDGARRSDVLAMIGRCRLGAGDSEAAIDAFGDALTAGPRPELRVELHYRRALAYNALWRPAEALSDLMRVREASDSVRGAAVRAEEFQYRLGVTTIRAGDWRGGRALLSEVASKFPGTREALDAKDRAAMTEFRVQVARVRAPKSDSVPSASGDHLVLVGHFARFGEAVREMERLRATGHPDAFVVP